MNFKTLVAPALLASTAFFGPGALEAEASTRYCYNTNVGDRICIEAVVKGFCDLTDDVNAALAFHTALLLQLAEQRLRFRSSPNRDGRFDVAYRKAEVLYSFVNTTMSFLNR